jgi:DnaK suppressor protein
VTGANKRAETVHLPDMASIKKILEKRKQELEGKLSLLHEQKGPAEPMLDVGDQVQSLSMEALSIALKDSEVEEYNRIVQALQKIADGTYGLCSDCGEPISEKRLISYPNASRCLSCQELSEEQYNLGL